jgi:large subunit ribosomal protein L5
VTQPSRKRQVGQVTPGRESGAREEKRTGGIHVIPRLKEMYRTEVVPRLMEQMSYGNINQVPRLEKIVVNMGVGAASQDVKLLDAAVEDLRIVTGQQPMITRAKKSIAGFKIRKGMPIGAKVTLRGDRMWEFMDRLLATALPRIRDFRGINPNSFDGRGNYSMGVDEQLIFPEVDYDKVDRVRGMDITFVSTARTDDECRALLDAFAFPFKRQ